MGKAHHQRPGRGTEPACSSVCWARKRAEDAQGLAIPPPLLHLKTQPSRWCRAGGGGGRCLPCPTAEPPPKLDSHSHLTRFLPPPPDIPSISTMTAHHPSQPFHKATAHACQGRFLHFSLHQEDGATVHFPEHRGFCGLLPAKPAGRHSQRALGHIPDSAAHYRFLRARACRGSESRR